MYRLFTPLSRLLDPVDWPLDFFTPALDNFLDLVHIVEHREVITPLSAQVQMRIAFERKDLSFEIPGLDGFSLGFAGSEGDSFEATAAPGQLEFEDQGQDLRFHYEEKGLGEGWIELALTYSVTEDGWELTLHDAKIELEFSEKLLKRAKDPNPLPGDEDENSSKALKEKVKLSTKGDISVNQVYAFKLKDFNSFDLPYSEIGDTGIKIRAKGVKLEIPSPQGLKITIDDAKVDLQSFGIPAGLEMKNCIIDRQGLSGIVDFTAGASVQNVDVAGDPFFQVTHVDLEFQKSVLVRSLLNADVQVPFFDGVVQAEILLDAAGQYAVRLSGAAGALKTIDNDVLRFELDGLGLALSDGELSLSVSGLLTPLFGGLDWPSFDVKELSIDSKGHVHLDGGWLNVPEQKTLDFYGFKIEISQIGFGTNDDGTRWIGFSGALHLVDGLQAGASVEGLRITWDPTKAVPIPKMTLNGAGLEMSIPDVLYFKGEVSYHELTDGSGNSIHRFDGDIHLTLETPELEIDGTLVIGSVKGPAGRYNFFAIYVDLELPTGIPLASTGLGIYGLAGLFALQMEPNKLPGDMWFSIDHSKSFYHHPEQGITDLKTKWIPRKGSFAVGAGITLGTLSDNGYTFNGKFLLAIVLPGPIVLLQGAASFLTKRADQQDEGKFRALAVLDGRAGSLLIGLDAEYKKGTGGELIDISGSMEAFYSFNDSTAWHLYLGKNEPRSLRIRALFAKLVEANAYFMLDAHQLALGAWFGYNNAWSFGPLSIRLEAWADGNALISFKPSHFHGDLWLHALVELHVFGLGLGLSLDARIAADVFTPYHLRGEFSVGIKLPWPFKKKIGATVILEWGPRPVAPPLPLPVVNVGIEHFKSSVTWPLPRPTLLLPSYDDGEGFLTLNTVGSGTEPAETAVPSVPLDARIAITFARSVHDDAMVGSNPQGVVPNYEAIGDPLHGSVLSARYALQAVSLERKAGNAWQTVAASPASTSSSGPPPLWGQWSVVPQLPDVGGTSPRPGQTKLLLWAKTPFEFNRHTGSSWEEWVSDALPGYPCVPVPPAQETCFGFGSLLTQASVPSPLTLPGAPAVTLSWGFGPASVRTLNIGRGGVIRLIPILCFPAAAVQHGIRVHSEAPGSKFRLILAQADSAPGPAVEPQPIQPAPGPITPRSGDPIPPRLTEGTDVVPREAVPTCVDVRGREAGTLSNPWKSVEGARFTVRGADGALLPVARIERWGQGAALGLNAGFELFIDLPCPAAWVTLLVTHRPPFRIVAFNAAGTAVATHAPNGTGGTSTETIRLDGPAITRIGVYADGNEKLIHQVCFLCAQPTGTSATGTGADGTIYGPFVPFENVISVDGHDMPVVMITGDGPLCLEQICVTPDPEAGQLVRQDERIQHQLDELAHWQARGEVLAPNSFYRLTVQTHLDLSPASPGLTDLPPAGNLTPVEHAYFRTGGPPGLTVLSKPEGVTTSPFVTGLEDLTRYVRETTPPTVPPPGERRILFKPFYRAYDFGVELNENYVEQMYRMDGRDLGLYLYDANNQPALDGLGRLLMIGDQWGNAETLSLSERETRWITLIDAANCLPKKLDPKTFPKNKTLASADPGRVLVADTLHEARLVPLLLHETFPGGVLGSAPGGWYPEDAGPGGPSGWKLGEVGEPPSRFVEQSSSIGGSASPDRPGTLLLVAAAQDWTDYRLSMFLRAAAGAVGVVVRHQGPGTGYRFSLDGRVRRLVKGGSVRLGEDHFAYQKDHDYQVTFEAIGSSLRVYLDGEAVFAVTDGDFTKGRIGLYTCQSPGARFTDVRVDDFGAAAPVVYRFQLTTSLYANFFHHLHSFQDETWKADLAAYPALENPPVSVGSLLNEAVPPSFSPPSEAEARAYEDLATRALGPAARQNPAQVEVTRLEQGGTPVAFLVRSPEPLAWDRIELALSGTPRHLPAPEAPGTVKLTGASFGAILPGDESATLLLREATDLSRYRIELRELPGVLAEPLDESGTDLILFLEGFAGDPVATLARFTVVNEGTAGGPSDWRVEGGALIQITEIGGGAEPELPGTVALAGDPTWTDYRTTADLRCDSGGTLGLVFRWVDGDNYYRLYLDAGLKIHRLVKSVAGQVSVLWEEPKGYTAGEAFRLTVEGVGSRLTGFLGSDRLFEITDATHTAGQVGLYCAGNAEARFESLEVRLPSLDARALVRDRFAAGDLADWGRVDEVPGTQPSAMETAGGELVLHSFVQQGAPPEDPGTYAYTGDTGWTDAIYSARLRCSAGAPIGLVFRGKDLKNYYRFSMNAGPGSYRRLIKRVNGTVTVLWEDGGSYPTDRSLELAVVAVGRGLRGYLDGIPLFAVEDGDVPSGLIALYARGNSDARFSEVRVFPASLAFAGWTMDESFDSLIPGRWSFFEGLTPKPLPDSWKAEGGALRPAGTDPTSAHLALTGDPAAADYRLAVRVLPGLSGLVGAVFRYLDADNFLFFLLGIGDQRLIGRVKGQDTLLWQGAGAVTAGREISLTFEAMGERLAGWLDGVELFRLDSAGVPAGQVGIFAAGSPGTQFTEVRLAGPVWSAWYDFGGEDRLPAGTRVRVSSGSEVGAVSSTEAGVERRFAAPLGEAGRLRFPKGGAELRVVAPQGPGHRRIFVQPAEFVALASPKVVRRADGTGLVLLPFGAPSPLIEGQYRLVLTYHRERTGQVHPFSQAGDKSSEVAAIDIPWPAR